MFYEIFSNEADPTCGAGLQSAKTPLVLALEVIMHPLVHTLCLLHLFSFLAHCGILQYLMGMEANGHSGIMIQLEIQQNHTFLDFSIFKIFVGIARNKTKDV